MKKTFLCFVLCLAATVSLANPGPQWWIDRGVISTNGPKNDYGLVVVGQLKWIALQATAELDANLLNGAGPAIHQVVDHFTTNDNNAAVNIGMVKYLSALFYDRLIAEGYPVSYPWTATTSDDQDQSPARIGQVKNAFFFVLDTDNDGLLDWWERRYFSSLAAAGAFHDSDGDGLSNLQEYELGSNPVLIDTDDDGFNDGVDPNLLISDPNDPHLSNSANIAFRNSVNAYGFDGVLIQIPEKGWYHVTEPNLVLNSLQN